MVHNDTAISKFTQSFFFWTVSRIILTGPNFTNMHFMSLYFTSFCYSNSLSHFINVLLILAPLIKALNNILLQSWQFCSSCSSLSLVRLFALKLELITTLSNFIYIIKKPHENKNQKPLNHVSFIKKTKENQKVKFDKSTLYIKGSICI